MRFALMASDQFSVILNAIKHKLLASIEADVTLSA